MNKLSQLDKLGVHDELIDSEGRLILPTQKEARKIIGVLEAYNNVTGKRMFKFNDVIILGATYLVEKFFNKRSTYTMSTLSADLGINAGITPTQDNLKDEFVFGFVVGNEGAETSDLVHAVKFKDKTVSGIIPMRVVDIDSDLPTTERVKYAMRREVGDKVHYYAKRFSTDIAIHHLFTDGTEIPPTVDQVDTTLGLLVYGEAVLQISNDDLREYYMNQYGSLNSCRFNSLGLVAGFMSGGDFAGVRTVTKLNIPNMPLRDGDSSYTFTYKVYAV